MLFSTFGWMKDLRGVKRDSDAFALAILVNHVTPTLPCKRKSDLLQYSDDLASR
jgi:hypothetical protein